LSTRFSASFFRRAARFLRREAWVIVITLLALVTRLYWNLAVHPPRNYVFSDMGGYFARADDFAKQPLTAAYDYLSFFPWGTHAFLGLVKKLFTTPTTCPRELTNNVAAPGCAPMDVALALLGVLAVFYTTLLARRMTQHGPPGAAAHRRWVYVVIGLGAVFYYPFLAQGGFYMSEVPFLACLAAAAFHSVRLVDEGKTSDAVLFGIFTGLGSFARPQMLMSVAFLAVFWLFRRRRLPGATLAKLAIACVPLGLLLLFSAIRTTRHIRQHNPSDIALVSTNDALNYAFGRCHPIAIEAKTRGYRSFFGPPSLGALNSTAKELRRKKEWIPLELKPAFPDDLTCESNKKHKEKKEPTEPCLMIEGKMWSRDVLGNLARKCVAQTGLGRQAYYAFTHLVLNFAFNVAWPDSGQKLQKKQLGPIEISTGRPIMEAWQIGFGATVAPFAFVACILAFWKRRTRDGMLAMHFWAAMLVGALYFGDTRLRTPYDCLLLILGIDLMARFFRRIGRRLLGALAPRGLRF
jgi:hypothetical protein